MFSDLEYLDVFCISGKYVRNVIYKFFYIKINILQQFKRYSLEPYYLHWP